MGAEVAAEIVMAKANVKPRERGWGNGFFIVRTPRHQWRG
jgi:hypothetical protein